MVVKKKKKPTRKTKKKTKKAMTPVTTKVLQAVKDVKRKTLNLSFHEDIIQLCKTRHRYEHTKTQGALGRLFTIGYIEEPQTKEYKISKAGEAYIASKNKQTREDEAYRDKDGERVEMEMDRSKFILNNLMMDTSPTEEDFFLVNSKQEKLGLKSSILRAQKCQEIDEILLQTSRDIQVGEITTGSMEQLKSNLYGNPVEFSSINMVEINKLSHILGLKTLCLLSEEYIGLHLNVANIQSVVENCEFQTEESMQHVISFIEKYHATVLKNESFFKVLLTKEQIMKKLLATLFEKLLSLKRTHGKNV